MAVSRASSGRAPYWQGPGASGGSVASSSPLPAGCTSRTQAWVPSAVRAAVPPRNAMALGDCVDLRSTACLVWGVDLDSDASHTHSVRARKKAQQSI